MLIQMSWIWRRAWDCEMCSSLDTSMAWTRLLNQWFYKVLETRAKYLEPSSYYTSTVATEMYSFYSLDYQRGNNPYSQHSTPPNFSLIGKKSLKCPGSLRAHVGCIGSPWFVVGVLEQGGSLVRTSLWPQKELAPKCFLLRGAGRSVSESVSGWTRLLMGRPSLSECRTSMKFVNVSRQCFLLLSAESLTGSVVNCSGRKNYSILNWINYNENRTRDSV